MNAWTAWHPDYFQVYDSDGNWLETMSVGQFREVCSFDTDENGDLFVLSWENWHDDNEDNQYDPGEGLTSQLQHFEYRSTAPYYVEDPSDALDTSEQFTDNNQVWDIAVSYLLDRIYALKGNHGNPVAPFGEMYTYDIDSDGSLSLNTSIQSTSLFPDEVYGAYPSNYGYLIDGDVEIDHAAEVSEGCRIIVMAQKQYPPVGHYIGVMDSDLNFIDLQITNQNVRRYSFSIGNQPDPSNRPIFASGYTSGLVYLSDAPAGW